MVPDQRRTTSVRAVAVTSTHSTRSCCTAFRTRTCGMLTLSDLAQDLGGVSPSRARGARCDWLAPIMIGVRTRNLTVLAGVAASSSACRDGSPADRQNIDQGRWIGPAERRPLEPSRSSTLFIRLVSVESCPPAVTVRRTAVLLRYSAFRAIPGRQARTEFWLVVVASRDDDGRPRPGTLIRYDLVTIALALGNVPETRY